jgi:hypothetical protein
MFLIAFIFIIKDVIKDYLEKRSRGDLSSQRQALENATINIPVLQS